MPPNRLYEWLVISLIAALGGVTRHVVAPDERVGISGFLSATTVGVFCGGLVASLAQGMQAPVEAQWFVAGLGSVCGFSVLRSFLAYLDRKPQENHNHYSIHGDVNQVGGNIHNGPKKEKKNERDHQ